MPTRHATPTDAELSHLRAHNLGRLLDEAHLAFDQGALARLQAAGYPMMTAAHTHVLRTMRLEGTTLTDMAAEARISKQAMSRLVAAFVRHGFLAWIVAPASAGRLVAATPAGRELLAAGVAVLHDAELQLDVLIGAADLAALRRILLRLRAARVDQAPGPAPAGHRRRRA